VGRAGAPASVSSTPSMLLRAADSSMRVESFQAYLRGMGWMQEGCHA
jgi:hypothetical protein